MERLSEFTNKIKDTEIYNYIMKFSSTPVGMYIMWIVLHYLAANLYNMQTCSKWSCRICYITFNGINTILFRIIMDITKFNCKIFSNLDNNRIMD